MNGKNILLLFLCFSSAVFGMEQRQLKRIVFDKFPQEVGLLIENSIVPNQQWWYCDQILGERYSTTAVGYDGKYLAIGSGNGAVWICDTIVTEKELVRCKHDAGVSSIIIKNNYLVTGSKDKTARIWDITTGEQLICCDTDSYVTEVGFDGYVLATNPYIGKVCLWNGTTGEKLTYPVEHKSSPLLMSFIGDSLATVSARAETAQIWNVKTGQELFNCKPNASIASILLNENFLITGLRDGTIQTWDRTTGKEFAFCHKQGENQIVSLSLDGKHLAAGSQDTTVCVWDIVTGKKLVSCKQDSKDGAVVSVNLVGDCLVTQSQFGMIYMFRKYTDYTLEQLRLKSASLNWFLIEKPNKNITTIELLFTDLVKTNTDFADEKISAYDGAMTIYKSFPENMRAALERTILYRIQQHGKDDKNRFCNIQ